MRLVQVDGNGGLRLTAYLVNHTNAYAILSHTWGEDEDEVSFKDLQENTGNSKRGYKKLQFCAKQAALDGLQYFWVDTCCIDKSNSTEFGEAINSMFSWYRNSTKCYVYMSDVSTNADGQVSLNQSWESAFRNSKWFTRGWTLQELIAPSSVDFFSSEGKLLGYKTGMEQQIHNITGIAIPALQGSALSEFSVTERLSWAKSRQTKRDEDMAYCLLGLFDVFMLPIYGEGKERALRRLKREIHGHSINYPLDDLTTSQTLSNSMERQLTLRSELSTGYLSHDPDVALYLDFFEQYDGYKSLVPKSYEDQFETERLRLKEWFRHIELLETEGGHMRDIELRHPDLLATVRTLLHSACELFEGDSATLRTNVKSTAQGVTNTFRLLHEHTSSSKHASREGDLTVDLKRGAQFANLLQKFRYIVDTLYNLIPANRQQYNPQDPHLIILSGSREGRYPRDEVRHPAVPSRIHQLLDNESRRVREQVETTIGDWLGITHFGQQYNMHQHFDKQLSLHLNGTCEWIFDRSEYREWESGLSLDENSKFLWIHGPAGHGKSVISAHLIKHLKSMAHYGVGFFFCSSHAASAGSLSYIIRSWIYQIARSHSDALDLVQGFTQRSEVRRTAPDTEIWLVFQSLISQPFNLVFFLDGLDEYPQSNDNRVDFLHRLKQVSAKTATRFLITSREEVDIKAMLSPADQSKGQILLEYRISAKDVKNDVILYSKSIVDRKLPNKNEKLRTKLANQLADKCDGMFLWVKMQQEHLNSYKNGKQLEKIVGEMPIELNEVYEKSWETINRSRPDAREQAVAILRWASFAERPLTVSEISEALFIETDGDQVGLQLDELPDAIDEAYINDGIIGICCSLVEVRARDSEIALGSRTIHLIHPSVREFLSFVMIGNANVTFPQPFMDQLDQSSQHGLLARICLAYLNDKRIWDSADEERHFLNYAATSWHSHFKYSEKSDHQISSLVSQFFESSNESFKTWAKYYEKTQQSSGYEYQDIGTPMYYAALFSLLPTMEAIWRRDPSQLNAVGGRYGTPMQAACATGNKTAFDMLIAWGADPNVNAGQFGSALTAAASLNLKDAIVTLIDKGAQLELKDPDGRTALSTSARDGHVEVVRLLLEHGAETTIVNKYGWTPVNSAAHDGHAEVIGLLLDHGADMNTGNKEGGKTPIYTAADRGFPDVVRLLLERGADVANQNDSGWTPVFAAATNGHTEVVRLLLDRGADAATPGSDEWTPMNSAASWGYEEIIKLLLERGADPGIPNNKGWVPLATGVLNGHLEIARLFLDRGTDANIQDNEGNTSLYFAARAGHIKIVQLLLERGADPTISNNKSLTPVLVAAWNGHVETVRELLDRGANINTQDSDGDTPLGLAARDGHTEVVRLLISRGAHINMPNNDGVTPLFFAASGGFVSVVHQLLEHGAEVNISRTDRFGPLHTAAENGSIEVVRQLLDGGAKVNATGKFELTALHLAARQGHIDIASLLLQEGANINITEADNWTSLHNAARNGHVETVSLLLKEGANAYSADNDGWTPLHLATRYGHVEMVSILLKDGANANSADNAGWTPLHLATRYGHVETVSLLLKEGANADSVDNDGWTPLHQAANQGHVDIVGLLIQAGAHSMPLAKPEKMYTNDLTAPDAFFQRSALSMAARSGHKSIVKLLLQNYAETGQRVRDEDAKIVANPDEDYRSYVGCDRCGNHILDTAPYFHCMSCIDGRFDVCQACFDASILCLDSTHKLIKRVYALDGY